MIFNKGSYLTIIAYNNVFKKSFVYYLVWIHGQLKQGRFD